MFCHFFLHARDHTFKSIEILVQTLQLVCSSCGCCIVLILFLISRFLYPFLFPKFTLVYFVLLVLLVQVVHDLSFYAVFSAVPKGFNGMIDTFKEYGKEMGGYAILGDSIIILFSCIAASFMAGRSFNTNLIYLISMLYCVPYLIYT